MPGVQKRWVTLVVAAALLVFLWHRLVYSDDIYFPSSPSSSSPQLTLQQEVAAAAQYHDPDFLWRHVPVHHPVVSFNSLPRPPRSNLPPIQAVFEPETIDNRTRRQTRQRVIKGAMTRCWDTYRAYGWMRDEVTPVTHQGKDTFGAWGATLIDSLDTLWIMGLRSEFAEAVAAVHANISFSKVPEGEVNVFETTIRFLGGLLGAYDLSGDPRLLAKARDAGDMLYKAFDTPNHMPITRWNMQAAANGDQQAAPEGSLLAEVGSLSLEFTRLSLATGDPRYFDAIQRITNLLAKQQMRTKLPGMWSVQTDPAARDFDVGGDYSLGGMADSMYEYLPKMYALLGGQRKEYRDMYLRAMETAEKNLFYRPMLPERNDILVSGQLHLDNVNGENVKRVETSAGHLTCFTGGMFALGAKLTATPAHLAIADRLTRGCTWAYGALNTGVMPEVFHLVPCATRDACVWDEKRWHAAIQSRQGSSSETNYNAEAVIRSQRLPKGFTAIGDSRYILRPEALESVFMMHRVTADPEWAEVAWDMWTAIDALTRTEGAHSAVADVNPAKDGPKNKMDSMESFWTAETLKYLYLIFSEPDLVSLDEFVFNTEAHPFKRLRKQ